MVVSEIVLHNFGVFRGRHTIALGPPSSDKPVILFGGQNGAGKSTLLEAFQHALYGRQAPRHRLEAGAYDDYLSRTIHRSERPDEGAAVEVAFRFPEHGREVEQRVRRSWSLRGARATESVEVSIDDHADSFLSEAWAERVNQFIPPSLSQLFFFDGERVEALADPASSKAMLSTAIDALLGMDLVTQLQADLLVLERRKARSVGSPSGPSPLAELERELQVADRQLTELRERQASHRNDLDRADRVVTDLQSRFEQEGGDLLDQRVLLERQQAQLGGELAALERQLAEAATHELPLLLVRELLSDCVAQAAQEQAQARADLVAAEVQTRAEQLLSYLSTDSAGSPSVLAAVRAFFERDRANMVAVQAQPPYLQLSDAGLLDARQLLTGTLSRERLRAAELLRAWEGLRQRVDDVDRRLAAVPDAEAVAELLERRRQAHANQQALQATMAQLRAEESSLEATRSRIAGQLDEVTRVAEESAFADYEAQRFLSHTRRARATLTAFRVAAVRQHAARLERLILQGYSQLLHKTSLLSGVRIDPETCALVLLDPTSNPLPPGLLSAGERQLLAVSMLWGLARASGRPLPVVIDTPLSRLDAAHRSNLVQRYFPYASHQVLLLSTDEEIDQRYYRQLKPWVGRTYLLDYVEDLGSTRVQPGYFWEE